MFDIFYDFIINPDLNQNALFVKMKKKREQYEKVVFVSDDCCVGTGRV